MYSFVLALHNLVRWVVLILSILAAVNACLGWLQKREWTARDSKIGSYCAISLDIQLLLGLLLYFALSPVTRAAFADFGAAMGNSNLRFFAVEHTIMMLLALVFAHLGNRLPRKAPGSAGKFKRAAIFFVLAALLILGGMPWARPFLPVLF